MSDLMWFAIIGLAFALGWLAVRPETYGLVDSRFDPRSPNYRGGRKGFHDPETLLVSVDAASWDSIVAFTRGGAQ